MHKAKQGLHQTPNRTLSASVAQAAAEDQVWSNAREQVLRELEAGVSEIEFVAEVPNAIVQSLGAVLEAMDASEQQSLPVFRVNERYVAYASPVNYKGSPRKPITQRYLPRLTIQESYELHEQTIPKSSGSYGGFDV